MESKLQSRVDDGAQQVPSMPAVRFVAGLVAATIAWFVSRWLSGLLANNPEHAKIAAAIGTIVASYPFSRMNRPVAEWLYFTCVAGIIWVLWSFGY